MGKKKEKDGVWRYSDRKPDFNNSKDKECPGYAPDLNKITLGDFIKELRAYKNGYKKHEVFDKKTAEKLVDIIEHLGETSRETTKDVFVLSQEVTASIEIISLLIERVSLLEARYSLLEDICRPFLRDLAKDITEKNEGSDAADRWIGYEEELVNTLTHYTSDSMIGHNMLELHPEEKDPFVLLSHPELVTLFKEFCKQADIGNFTTSTLTNASVSTQAFFDPFTFSEYLEERNEQLKREEKKKALKKAKKKEAKVVKKLEKAKKKTERAVEKLRSMEMGSEEDESFLDSLEVENTKEPKAEPETKETTEE